MCFAHISKSFDWPSATLAAEGAIQVRRSQASRCLKLYLSRRPGSLDDRAL